MGQNQLTKFINNFWANRMLSFNFLALFRKRKLFRQIRNKNRLETNAVCVFNYWYVSPRIDWFECCLLLVVVQGASARHPDDAGIKQNHEQATAPASVLHGNGWTHSGHQNDWSADKCQRKNAFQVFSSLHFIYELNQLKKREIQMVWYIIINCKCWRTRASKESNVMANILDC